MSETRKNHHNIDGAQVKEDDNVASYKPIPESEIGFRTSKSNLTKSKEKVSDEAEEKLLGEKGGEKVVCVGIMPDAKYVVDDHRNGDAKIELDANKKQFSGLTKEELLKYADDPFWVRLRWFMFVMFWALWLCMLAGAIAIIVRAPKCSPPTPKTWYEKGPLVDMTPLDSYEELEEQLPLLKSNMVQGIFTDVAPTYEALDDPKAVEWFKAFVDKAKEYGIKVIVDLTPNFVSITSDWFRQSVNRSGDYSDYFIWAKPKEYVNGTPMPHNNWVSTLNTSAWTFNEDRKEFYLHQYRADQPDLNFKNPSVVNHFNQVLKTWMKAGAAGVRLINFRQALVNSSLPDEEPLVGRGVVFDADHTSYPFYRHSHTSDQRGLDSLLAQWAATVDEAAAAPGTRDSVFTMLESARPELFLLDHNVTSLRPRSAAPLHVNPYSLTTVADLINTRLAVWPAVHLKADKEMELAEFSLLLPATPIIDLDQLTEDSNTTVVTEKLSHLVPLREDASIQHGFYRVAAVPTINSTARVLACARWKPGHTGYLAVLNPNEEDLMANVTMPSVPPSLTVHHVSANAVARSGYSSHESVQRERVLVPSASTLVLSYVPEVAAEN